MSSHLIGAWQKSELGPGRRSPNHVKHAESPIPGYVSISTINYMLADRLKDKQNSKPQCKPKRRIVWGYCRRDELPAIITNTAKTARSELEPALQDLSHASTNEGNISASSTSSETLGQADIYLRNTCASLLATNPAKIEGQGLQGMSDLILRHSVPLYRSGRVTTLDLSGGASPALTEERKVQGTKSMTLADIPLRPFSRGSVQGSPQISDKDLPFDGDGNLQDSTRTSPTSSERPTRAPSAFRPPSRPPSRNLLGLPSPKETSPQIEVDHTCGRREKVQAVKPRAKSFDEGNCNLFISEDGEGRQTEILEMCPQRVFPFFSNALSEEEPNEDSERYLALHKDLASLLRRQERMQPTEWSVELPAWSWKTPSGLTLHKLASLRGSTPSDASRATPSDRHRAPMLSVMSGQPVGGPRLNGSWPPKDPLLPKL